MRALMSILESSRLYLPAVTVPYAFAWADGDGKALLVIAMGLLVLLHITSFDTRMLELSLRPRLGLTRDRDHWNPAIVDRTRAIAGVLLALTAFLLLFVSPSGALLVALAAALVVLFSVINLHRRARWRMMFAEILWPGFMLIVPMILFSWALLSGEEREATGIVGRGATSVGVLTLAGYVLLCQIRDARLDATRGQHTLVTLLGRPLANLVLFLLLASLLIVTSRGAGIGMWEWWVPTIAGIASLATIWGIASDADDGIPTLWMAASFVIAIGVVA